MDEDAKQIMKEQLAISKESLVLLKRMNRDLIYRRVFGALKYIVVAALVVLSYIQLQPYLQSILGATAGIQQTLGTNPLAPGGDIQKLIQQFINSAKTGN